MNENCFRMQWNLSFYLLNTLVFFFIHLLFPCFLISGFFLLCCLLTFPYIRRLQRCWEHQAYAYNYRLITITEKKLSMPTPCRKSLGRLSLVFVYCPEDCKPYFSAYLLITFFYTKKSSLGNKLFNHPTLEKTN